MTPTIMKFGGTSVENASAFARVAGIVRSHLDRRPVVVVSAMSRMTDALVESARRAAAGDPESARAGLDEHLARHQAVANALLPPTEARDIDAALAATGRELTDVLAVIARHPGTRAPLHDEVLSFGERLSSLVLAAVLRAGGIPGLWVDARRCIVTTDDHSRAIPQSGPTGERTRAELVPAIESGRVPVLGGFIGSTAEGATTTLGRGGSDYSAALVGAALGAGEIQIWTDVTGFLTADPRVVSGTRNIAHLSYAEAAELAFFGAKVLHPKTIQPAVERGIPVRVCNSREPEAWGTLIDSRAEPSPRGIKAIAHRAGITVVQVSSAGMLGTYGFLRALFEVFDRYRTAVDVVSTSEVSVSLSVEDTRSLPAIVEELGSLGSVRVEGGFALISVVGEGLSVTPGVAARVFGTLADINIAMISQGASSINLTFLVAEAQAREAVSRLHAAFFG